MSLGKPKFPLFAEPADAFDKSPAGGGTRIVCVCSRRRGDLLWSKSVECLKTAMARALDGAGGSAFSADGQQAVPWQLPC
ncbi:MAG: hypothetical protein KGR98_10500 [Verrucomicrobia bacterium]|nr:hypothetical protein [Verrucomicrobiota bacterium]